MRKRYPIQQRLGTIPIGEVSISQKSRHELPKILLGLQHIFLDAELRESVLSLVESVVLKGKQATGRTGLDLWEILVLGVVRLGLDADYDRLEDLANNHSSLRGILGVGIEHGFDHKKIYGLQRLKDNVSLLDEAVLMEINQLVVQAGHKLIKKKDEGLRVKADSYVLESNVHYPTDVNLLYDSGRKCLDLVKKATEVQSKVLPGWRKLKYWQRQLRNQERSLTKTLGHGGRNRASRVAKATQTYLETARKILAKLDQSKEEFSSSGSAKLLAIIAVLDSYQLLLDKHIDLVRRRLLEGEKIPHSEKLFSIFEQHTEWINKGKKHKKVELGKNVLIATDQFHFILHHQVMEGQQDVHLAVPTARTICEKYRQQILESISFDRGFYSGPNFDNLQAYAHQVILPKKGNKSQEEAQREASKSFVSLRHQHSAVEANINQLEHHGLNKCPDKGIKAFKSYTAWGVLAYNLHRIGKILLEKQKQKTTRAKTKTRKAA